MKKKIKLKLFTPGKIGKLKLRNRSIKSAAFEGMCPDSIPSDSLVEYHWSVAAGGIGMTTVAYVSVTPDGRSFRHQAWMSPEIIPQLKRLTDAVHREGAAASIQLGHCGNMSDKKVTGTRSMAPSSVLNIFGLNLPKKMSEADIAYVIQSFGSAVSLAKKAGFDAVEIHAGHGYLISQFLSPYTNRRKDRWGGSLENRARFLRSILAVVRNAAGPETAVLVKMNLRDGFPGGLELDEAIQVAKIIESEGADAIILSGGFVSKSPMYIMRGETPHKELIKNQSNPLIRLGMFIFSRFLIKDFPFTEAYFLEDALKVRNQVKLPVVYVGGLLSLEKIEEVLAHGFNFVALARGLIIEPDFINKLKKGETTISRCAECKPCNRCIATMYNGEAVCLLKQEND